MLRAALPPTLARALGLRDGEGPRTLRLFALVFLVTATAVLARSAQREIFLGAYPRSAISDAFLWAAGVLCVASLGLSALAARQSFLRLTQALLLTGVAVLVGTWSLLWLWPAAAPMSIYVGVEVMVSLLLAQGWAVATEAVDVRSAKRLLPLVGFGAGLAWTLGGLGVGALAKQAGPALILGLAPLALLGAWAVLGRVAAQDLSAGAKARPPPQDGGFVGGLVGGLRFIVTEPLLRVLALLVTLELVVERITDLQLLASAQERFAGQSGAISSFMGLFYGVTGAVTLLTPLWSGRVLSRFGSTRALLAGQVWVLLGSLAFLFFPLFGVVVALTGVDRVIKQAVGGAARGQVMGALPTARRVQAGTLLRGVLAALFSGLAAVGLKAVPADLPVHWLSVASVLLMAALAWVTERSLRRAYLGALQRSVDRTRLDLDSGDTHQELDREQVATLADELESPDEARATLAVSLLGAAELEVARPLLARALAHPSPEVRAQALAVLGRRGEAEDVPTVEAALARASAGDADDLVRLAALKALVDLKAVGALESVTPHVTAARPRVRALARAARARLLALGAGGGRGAGLELVAFETMLASGEPAEREAAAWAVGQVGLGTAEVRTHFAPLLADSHPEVRRAAVGASGQFTDQGIVRALVYALEEPATASAAFDAFGGLSEEGVGQVEAVLDGAPTAIVSRTASALARGGGARATGVLHGLLDHGDPQVRYRAARALTLRRRSEDWRPPGEDLLLRAIEAELAQGYRYHAALAALAKEAKAGEADKRFVAGEVDSRIQETERRLLALVAMVADPRIARLSHHLRDASPQVTARVLELVEESLDQRLAKKVIPFLERQAPGPAKAGPTPDAVELLVDTGDEHLQRVARLALAPRVGAPSPDLKDEEEHMLRMVERLRFLRSVPVFKNLSPEDLMKLAEIASPSEHHAGKVIFKKGDPGDVLCVVVSGKVEIRNQGQVVATSVQNDFFGELALFDQEPRSADAVCVEDTELLEIGGADLESLMERRPEIAREIIRVLARRLRKTTQDLVGRSAAPGPTPSAPR